MIWPRLSADRKKILVVRCTAESEKSNLHMLPPYLDIEEIGGEITDRALEIVLGRLL